MRLASNSPADTLAIGEAIGRLLDRGIVVALVGELGSGKTVLAQGLAKGLDIDPGEYVSSPTFAIVNQYRGRIPIYHIDTYRLGDEAEMVALGYEEYFESDGVAIVEWADRVESLLPEKYLHVVISITGRETRELEIDTFGPWLSEVSADIEKALASWLARDT